MSTSSEAPTTETPAPADAVEAPRAEETPRAEEESAPLLGAPTRRRRTSRPDAVLAEAVEVARAGILEITDASTLGEEHRLLGVEDRLTTHLFECTLRGYRGWFWFATLSRVPRGKVATVCEVGLVPGEDALLAPAWVPWSDRVRPEEIEEERRSQEAAAQEAAEQDPPAAGESSSEDSVQAVDQRSATEQPGAQEPVEGKPAAENSDAPGSGGGTVSESPDAVDTEAAEEPAAEEQTASVPAVPQFLAPHITDPTKG